MKTPPEALDDALGLASKEGELLSTLAEALPARAPGHALRARLLASAASPRLRWAPFFDKLGALFDLDEAALMQMAERAALEDQWQPGPLPSVSLFHLSGGPAIASADAGLVRVAAGFEFPTHRHLGEERTLILEGEVRESSGLLRRPGDALSMPADSSHSFEVVSSKPLLYALVLFGGVEIGGIKFP
ncbi:MAG TPA: cupin domain-containing protein [Polyangiaceae bacterium]|nr:cupin domain-containing protein [Polyangiaceae bacterium]